MDKYYKKSNRSIDGIESSTNSTTSTDQSAEKFGFDALVFSRTNIAPDILVLYDELTALEQHAFRIAYEHLGSSFDYKQCISK